MTKRCVACGRFGCQGTCAKAMSKPIPKVAPKKHGHKDAVMAIMLTAGMSLSLSLTGAVNQSSNKPAANKASVSAISRATAVRVVPEARAETQVHVPNAAVTTSLTIVP